MVLYLFVFSLVQTGTLIVVDLICKMPRERMRHRATPAAAVCVCVYVYAPGTGLQ